MDTANWEKWWTPNHKFNANKKVTNRANNESAINDEYFTYTISPDCSSCSVSNNDQGNDLSFFNTDDFGNRTGYYMTGTMFGCLTTHKALKDCSWDYDTYECVMCSLYGSDEDLGYHIVHHHDDDEEHLQDECAADDEFGWTFLQV